jgi:DNA-binding response OmpR family regulator
MTTLQPPVPPQRVLVVDDETTVREVVVAYLEREGYRAAEAADGRAALEAMAQTPPDLVILDVMLPKIDGFTVLSRLRQFRDTPVILLSARTDESDRVLGLGLGADDYVVKPFSPRELAARVRSVLRRTRPAAPTPRLEYDRLVIDGTTREALVDGSPVTLTPKEFDLLAFLAGSPRQVFSRGQLLEQVWNSSADFQDPSTVTVHVRRLRQKIEDDPHDPQWIATVWGVGYRFEP